MKNTCTKNKKCLLCPQKMPKSPSQEMPVLKSDIKEFIISEKRQKGDTRRTGVLCNFHIKTYDAARKGTIDGKIKER